MHLNWKKILPATFLLKENAHVQADSGCACIGSCLDKGSAQDKLLSRFQRSLQVIVKRTVLEFVLPGDEGLAWWEGLTGLCAGFGLRVRYLDQAEIETLTRWVLNPNLEYAQV